MGLVKQLWMERLEDESFEKRAEWIREHLNDPNADEDTEGWEALEEDYHLLHPDPDYDDDWDVLGKSRTDIFNENIAASTEMLGLPLPATSKKNMLVMLHAHVVAALEAYLSSTFIEISLGTEVLMQKLVETDPEFAKRKFTIKEIFTKQKGLKDDLRQYLKDLIFHDIAKVREMYRSVFDFDFGDVSWLFQAVALRHHCVHRAGYDKDGNEVTLTEGSIRTLIEQCSKLVADVEAAITLLPKHGVRLWKF